MDNKDYYQILGITHDAPAEEIKRAYRRLAMQCHPDRNHGKEAWANQKFKEINEAFSVLGNPEKRREYDDFGSIANIGDIFSCQATRTTFEELFDDLGGNAPGIDFLDDIFGSDFKASGLRYRRFKRGFPDSARTRFERQSGVDLEDLFEPAKSPELTTANYEIVLSQEQAFRGMEKELVRKGKRLTVNIPAGVKTGSSIRLKNALKTTDGQPGDIIISVRIKHEC